MRKKIQLIRTIVPDQKGKGKSTRYYPNGSIGSFTRLGVHLSPFDLPTDDDQNGRPLGGWVYEDLTTRKVKKLEEGVDYILL